MKFSSRRSLCVAIFGTALALSGCGGNTGTQITTLNRTLDLSSVTVYSSEVRSTRSGEPVVPIALFSSAKDENVLLWGTRSSTDGTVATIAEAAYWTDLAKPLYAKYNEEGGLASVKDIDTGSYITFSALEGSSLVAAGFDATSGKTGSIRATLSGVGVTVVVLDDGRAAKKQVVTNREINSILKSKGLMRDGDPLAGFSTVFKDSDDRTRIITAIFRAAALVVDHPFDQQIRDIAGFLLLDQLTTSYTNYLSKNLTPGSGSSTETPLPYVSDLP